MRDMVTYFDKSNSIIAGGAQLEIPSIAVGLELSRIDLQLSLTTSLTLDYDAPTLLTSMSRGTQWSVPRRYVQLVTIKQVTRKSVVLNGIFSVVAHTRTKHVHINTSSQLIPETTIFMLGIA